MIDLKNKNALITGSNRGVGQQIARGLARLGCNIIVHGRTMESCAQTLALLQQYPVNTYTVCGDLSDEQQVLDVPKQVKNLNIHVDILYNNAAIMTPFYDDIWKHSREEWTETFKVNVMALYTLCGAFIPAMVENSFGRVINLTPGIKDLPELAPYGAS